MPSLQEALMNSNLVPRQDYVIKPRKTVVYSVCSASDIDEFRRLAKLELIENPHRINGIIETAKAKFVKETEGLSELLELLSNIRVNPDREVIRNLNFFR